jgi:hypothetical protein
MMGGVARGQRMSTWEYPAINGVSAEYGKNTGWIALQTQGAAVSDLSFYGSGTNSPAQAPNAIAITKKVYAVVQPGVSALRDVITERQQAPV